MADFYVGLMSGTSMDAIDAVLIRDVPGFPGEAHASLPYHSDTRTLLDNIVTQAQVSLADLMHADQLVAEDFARCAAQLLDSLDPDTRKAVKAIGMHGQTIFHAPELQQTLQIGNPSHVAAELGLPVVADIRRADLAAGGQGAPLAPAFHNQAFRSKNQDRAILNLGGIANITLLPSDPEQPVIGFDTGPASTLMDLWTAEHLGKPFDENGDWARSGTPNAALLASLLSDPYFSAPAPKSTGREYFHMQWLRGHLGRYPEVTPADIQATLCELTARSIIDAIVREKAGDFHVFVCGGGWNNRYLIEQLQTRLGNRKFESTGALGIDPQQVEGAAFAWIARQHLHGEPASLPSVTGASKPVLLGALYPANC